MSGEIDLSGEADPTDRMLEQQERAQDAEQQSERNSDGDHEGEMQTEEFDLEEALDQI